MSRLIMWNLITLDGFYEGAKPWDLAFHYTAWGDELEKLGVEQTGGAGALLFGRVTYEGMASYWSSAEGSAEGPIAGIMNRIPKYVCSRTLQSADWNNSTILSGEAAEEVTKLKANGTEDIFVFGSGDLSETLTKAGLFDEYRLCVCPAILGTGKPLFGRDTPGPKLKLLSSETLKTGGVELRYAPAQEEAK
jgi:dihydrofolate reductase